jgi:uncharacterized RDD family membrane protein YckC
MRQDGEQPALEIVAPEGFPVHFAIAGPAERLFAFGIDIALVLLAMLGFVIVFVIAGISLGFDEVWALLLLAMFVLRHGYFALFELAWQGATPGKRALALRVVSRDGGGLTADAVIARNLLRDVELFLPLTVLAAPEALVGPSPAWLWLPALAWVLVLAGLPFATKQRTRAGDLVAGTVVVRVPRLDTLEGEAAPISARGKQQPIEFTREQLAIYGEHELETLANILREADRGRADVLDLRIVARTIAQKIGWSGQEPAVDPLRFLRGFYRAQRASLEKRLLIGKRKASKYDQSG